MAKKPTAMTHEAIALTEKKMDMTLEDIIKMSKKPMTKAVKPRVSNKSQWFLNRGPVQGKNAKFQGYIDSRHSLRQGLLAQRRSNFGGNSFPLAAEAARRAATAPLRNRQNFQNKVANWNKLRNTGTVGHLDASSEGDITGGRMGSSLSLKQRPQTLDSLFANMKEQRMKMLSNQRQTQINSRRNVGRRQQRRGGRMLYGATAGYAI